jgi:formylglycine-generating enzyme required for sulfatase activity
MIKLCSLLFLGLLFFPVEALLRWEMPELVLIQGGSFRMGDLLGEGKPDEGPVHVVTLGDFYLAINEVTVREFETFVAETGYRSSAEGPFDPAAVEAMMARAASGELSQEEMRELHVEFLRYSGAGYWAAEERRWVGYNPETTWRNPGFEQAPDHPVMAVSWDDAIHYCNWLSKKAGMPVAYDIVTGGLLDENGNPTTDPSRVRGYRLPTEAEWEYAAREGGRAVRFGNGQDIARSREMNFRGDEAGQPYVEVGSYAKGTTPVGSFPPNRLGLHDMSGNAWEWVSDPYVAYDAVAATDPYGTGGAERILRGGRWGGDAYEARVSHRTSWPRNDRCNNSGFRVARSGGVG